MYYFSVKTEQHYSIFYLDNLDLVQYWINEIGTSQNFYGWLSNLISKRYSQDNCNIYECHYEDTQKYLDKADELINFILSIPIPEIDMNAYNIALNVSAEQFALKKVNEFRRSFFTTSPTSSNSLSNPDQNKSPSTEDFSDFDVKQKSHS